MVFGVRNCKLSLADSTQTVENNGSTGAIAAESIVNFGELLLSRDEEFGLRNFK
jgi:hypothetical protein